MLRVRDIMTRELVTVAPELSIREAMELLVTEHVGGAPVIAQHKVVGVISMTDLLAFAVSEPGAPDESSPPASFDSDTKPDVVVSDEPPPDWFAELDVDAETDLLQRFQHDERRSAEGDRFAQHTVSEVMNHVICSLPSSTRVDAAADYMRQASIHRVLVMDDGVLVGILTLSDIADAVADHKLADRTYVFGKPTVPVQPTPHLSRDR